MSLQDPSTYTPADLANPALDDAALRHIAQYRPDLRGYVLQHPACSPALAQMIHASAPTPQAPQFPQAPAPRTVPAVPHAPAGFNLGQAASTPPAQPFAQQPNAQQPAAAFGGYNQPGYGQQPAHAGYAQPAYGGQPSYTQPEPQHPQAVAWAQWFRQNTGRQPGVVDYQNAVAAGQLPHQVLMGLPSATPLTPGIPARLGMLGKLLLLIPLGAVIAIIGTFLPVVSIEMFGESFTATYWENDADGPIILVCSLIAIVVALLAVVRPAQWSYLLAGIVSILSQLLLFFTTINAFVQSADLDIPLGPAPVVILLGAVMVVTGAVMTIISARKL